MSRRPTGSPTALCRENPGAAARTSPLLQRQPEGAEEEDEESQAKPRASNVSPRRRKRTRRGSRRSRRAVRWRARPSDAAAAVAGGGRPLSGGERSCGSSRASAETYRRYGSHAPNRWRRGTRHHARAYTSRNHIAFAPGAYDAGSTEGRRLMARTSSCIPCSRRAGWPVGGAHPAPASAPARGSAGLPPARPCEGRRTPNLGEAARGRGPQEDSGTSSPRAGGTSGCPSPTPRSAGMRTCTSCRPRPGGPRDARAQARQGHGPSRRDQAL